MNCVGSRKQGHKKVILTHFPYSRSNLSLEDFLIAVCEHNAMVARLNYEEDTRGFQQCCCYTQQTMGGMKIGSGNSGLHGVNGGHRANAMDNAHKQESEETIFVPPPSSDCDSDDTFEGNPSLHNNNHTQSDNTKKKDVRIYISCSEVHSGFSPFLRVSFSPLCLPRVEENGSTSLGDTKSRD